MAEVTDPALIARLDAAEKSASGKKVTDPDLIAKLDAAEKGDIQERQEDSGIVNKLGPMKELAGSAEGQLHLGSQVAAAIPAAGASIYKLVTAPWGEKAKQATQAIQNVNQKMVYEPRSDLGKAIADTTDLIVSIPGRIAGGVTGGLAENETVKKAIGPTASAYLEGAANTAIQASPALLGARVGTIAARNVARAARDAESFIRGSTRLDWATLPAKIKNRLIEVAKEGVDKLKNLKPEAIERQVRFEKQKLPATRGEIERDISDITAEENVVKSPGGEGKDIANIHAVQDQRLHEMLDEQIKNTGSVAKTRQGVGESVQGAARSKEAASKGNYDRLYKVARTTEPDAAVSAAPLYTLLKNKPHIQHLDFMKSWLGKEGIQKKIPATAPGNIVDVSGKPLVPGSPATTALRGIKLNELDDLRTEAAGIASKGGKDGFYASQVVKAIDSSMEQIPSAAKAWKSAYNAFKAHKREFADTSSVAKLVQQNRSYKGEPRISTGKTFNASILQEDAKGIVKLKQSLQGTPAGKQAWKDLQGATLRYLKEKASGKKEIKGEKNQKEFNSTFLDAFNELDKDGKIDVIFEPKQAKSLRELAQSVEDLRTKPSGRIGGSDTVARALNSLSTLEKFTYVPAGRYLAGGARVLKAAATAGKSTRIAARAKLSNLEDIARKAKRLQTIRSHLKSYGRSAETGTLTLKKQDEDQE